ncbi:MAG: hypothetical protein FGM50_09295 [Mycobacterium sp.]|nr:hypothetical protein [Mycobacterium sp.]
MTGNAVVSVRSLLAVAVSATAVAAPTFAPTPSAATLAGALSPAVALRAAVEPLLDPVTIAAAEEFTPSVCCSNPSDDPVPTALTGAGNVIINAYDALEPWVAYGFELADYALSFVPGLWWIAPAIDLAYFSIEPLVQAGVYSFGYLLDGQFADIGPTLMLGVQEAVNNFVFFGIAWIGSLIPLPPLPPFPPVPPFGGAAVSAPAHTVGRGTAVPAAASAATVSVEDTDPAVSSPSLSSADNSATEEEVQTEPDATQAPRTVKSIAGHATSRSQSRPAAAPAPAAATASIDSDGTAEPQKTRSKATARSSR